MDASVNVSYNMIAKGATIDLVRGEVQKSVAQEDIRNSWVDTINLYEKLKEIMVASRSYLFW